MWKYTQEEIEELFAQRGYTVLGQYVNSCTPVEYRCAKGHVHAMSWSNLKFGKRCPTCSRQAVSERQRYSYAYVKEYFHANGCRLLSREYRNANTPLAYRCNCGNVSKVTFHHFNHGTRCNKCATARKVQAMQANGRVLTSAQQLHIQKLIGGE